MCFLYKLNLRVSFCTWHKVVDIDDRLGGSYSVHTSNSLHKSCRVPRGVVIENAIGPMKIHSFREDLCGNNHLIVIFLWPVIIRIKILFDSLFHSIAVGSCNQQDIEIIRRCFYCQFDRVCRIDGFSEYHELLWGISVLVKEGIFEFCLEHFQFRVVAIDIPTIEQSFYQGKIVSQQIDI